MDKLIFGSEFKMFLDVLKMTGIIFSIHWHQTKEDWQKTLDENGYNVTALATTVVRVGNIDHLFCNSSVAYTADETEIGPTGLFMLSRNRTTGVVTPRCLHLADGDFDTTITNLRAIERSYPDFPWSANHSPA